MNTVFVLVEEDTMELATDEYWPASEEAEKARMDCDSPEDYFVMEMHWDEYLEATCQEDSGREIELAMTYCEFDFEEYVAIIHDPEIVKASDYYSRDDFPSDKKIWMEDQGCETYTFERA